MKDRHDYSMDLDEGLKIIEGALSDAEEEVRKMGLGELLDARRPRSEDGRFFDGRLPSNVNSLDAGDLGEIYMLMCHHADFVVSCLTRSKAQMKNADEKVSLIRAKIRKSISGTQAEKEDTVNCDARYIEVMADWLKYKELVDLLEGIHEAATRDVRVVSRLIETKKIELEHGRRGTNLDNSRLTRPKRPAS